MRFASPMTANCFTSICRISKLRSFLLALSPLVTFILSLGAFLSPGICMKGVAQQYSAPAATPEVASLKGAADDTRYRIGPGDVLTIVVRKAQELSGPVRVDQRGMIRLPMLEGEVPAACRTESELASQIATLYLEYKNNPSVEVFVTEFQSRPVAVIGAVNAPGQFRLQRQVRLLELLSFAGGPSVAAGRVLNVIHTGSPSICQDNPVNSTAAANVQGLGVFELNETLKGKEGANPFVEPGDIVSLPEADQVFVVGYVYSPRAIPLKDKTITVSRAIAMAGGPQRDSKTSRIRIVRQTAEGAKKQEIMVDLKAISREKAEDVILLANDIVEVPSSTGKIILNAFTGAVAPALSQLPVRVIP
jgi:polysaccharide export outer membrane protein